MTFLSQSSKHFHNPPSNMVRSVTVIPCDPGINFCLSLLSYCSEKDYNHATWGKKGFSSSYCLHTVLKREAKARIQAREEPGNRNLNRRMEEHCLLACSLWGLLSYYNLGLPCPLVALPTVVWTLISHSLIKKIPPQTCLQVSLVKAFLS